MNTMKRRLLILLCAVIGTIELSAEWVTVDDIEYFVDRTTGEAEVSVQSTSLQKNNLVISDHITYNGKIYPVTSIGGAAFSGCSGLTGALTIPNSITEISSDAFLGCSGLTSVTIPNSVTEIGLNAFFYCSGLTGALTIPNSVTSIGDFAFSDCSGLTGSLIIPNSVTKIGRNAFGDCSGLTSVTIPNSVTKIAAGTFYECTGLTSVTIPNSVTEIDHYAFQGCTSLTSLTIPNSVTKIATYAFAYCSGLTSFTIPNTVTSIDKYTFSYCSGLTSLTIPNSVTSIGDYAFSYCSGLTSLTTPNSVTEIGSYAFYKCTGLTSVTIPNSETTIGVRSFSECSGLSEIYLPANLKSIGNFAFYTNSDNIKLISCKSLIPPIIGDNFYPAFSISTTNTATLIVPAESVDLYKKAFNWKEFLNLNNNEVEATSISLDITNETIFVGSSTQLVATISPANVTNKTITWTSSRPEIATVTNQGLVYGVAAGSTTITATIGNVSAICQINVLHRDPAIDPSVTTSERDIFTIAEQPVNMAVYAQGGEPNGWSYIWTKDGQTLGTGSELNLVAKNSSKSVVADIYRVKVENEIDKVVIFSETFDFLVHTYPPIDQSESNDSITISSDNGVINKTREGNTVTLAAPMPAGGNPQGWEYIWRNSQDKIGEGESIETVATMSTGTMMGIEKTPYYLEMKNYGPQGDLWGQFSLESTLEVYRRPLTPVDLLRKGNGSTHTLVIMAGISDSEIAQRGYEFVYGYTDADGRDHEVGCTPLRYFQIDRNVFDDPSCEKWCYALWRYADGSTISSGRRYLNGTADENFDASNFGNSRQPDADEFKTGSIVIKQLDGAVKVTVEAESDTHMELVSLSGVKVLQQDVEGYTFSTIHIDAHDVAPGIYLLYVANKQEQTVKKIAIK